jgi:hypothetical protein
MALADPRARELVLLTMARLGLDENDKIGFARAIELHPFGSPGSMIVKWLKRSTAPSFTYVMTMLSETGLLQPEAEAVWRGVSLREAERLVAAARERVRAQETAVAAARLETPRAAARGKRRTA